jgi:hypothetical protein
MTTGRGAGAYGVCEYVDAGRQLTACVYDSDTGYQLTACEYDSDTGRQFTACEYDARRQLTACEYGPDVNSVRCQTPTHNV